MPSLWTGGRAGLAGCSLALCEQLAPGPPCRPQPCPPELHMREHPRLSGSSHLDPWPGTRPPPRAWHQGSCCLSLGLCGVLQLGAVKLGVFSSLSKCVQLDRLMVGLFCCVARLPVPSCDTRHVLLCYLFNFLSLPGPSSLRALTQHDGPKCGTNREVTAPSCWRPELSRWRFALGRIGPRPECAHRRRLSLACRSPPVSCVVPLVLLATALPSSRSGPPLKGVCPLLNSVPVPACLAPGVP